jgi:PAS domain S-box-containing protein
MLARRLLTGDARGRPAEHVPRPELDAVAAISNALARAHDAEAVARVLLEEVSTRGFDFAALALVDEALQEASGLLAQSNGLDVDWWPDVRIGADEPSAILSAAREAAPIAVYDVEGSAVVSRRLADAVGAKSAAFVPLVSDRRVIGVLVVATTTRRHAFPSGELALLQALAGETALALERTRSAAALARALERERLVATIARKVRSEVDLDAVLQVAVEETGKALGVSRCFIRLGEAREPMPILAEWDAPGVEPIGAATAPRLPVLNLAARERQTAAIGDVANAPELDDPSLGSPKTLLDIGTRAVLATPILVFDGIIGVFGLHRREVTVWTEEEIALAEAVAREVGLAIHTARLLQENQRRLQQQRAFFRIVSALAEPISLPETLDAVAHAAREALGGSCAAVVMTSGGGFALSGADDRRDNVAAMLGGAGELPAALRDCARERRVIAAPVIGEDERFEREWRELAQHAGFSSLLAVALGPARDEDALVLVFFSDARLFSDDDLELARHLAGTARGALERSELYEAERNSRALAQQLARTGSLLATELDPAAVLEEVVRQAPALLGVEACAIRVLDGDELVVSAAAGEGAHAAIGARAPATSRLAGDVVQSRAPVAVTDIRGDHRLLELDQMLAGGYGAYLGVPLVRSDGGAQGVLAVYAKQPRAWREEEIEALLALAGNASAALSNAELYTRVALEKERSEAILGNIADGIVAVDREGRVVLWNAAAEEITGVPASEALGRTPLQVLQRNLAGGDAQSSGRLVSIQRGGEEVWLSMSEAVMRDPAGAVAGRIFAFRDISAERVVEQMKSDFVSTVSQELRRPLTSIYGFAATLLREDVDFGEEERGTFLGYIASESERLTNIVDMLLNVARLDTGDLQVNIAPTDVGPVVTEVVASAEATADVNGHSFVVDLPAEPLAAEADREKLRQILESLVDNAVKYSPDGGTVTVAARRKNDTVEVRVEDEGVGIPAVERQRIFTKFYRRPEVGATRGGAGGTGLGLFIAQGLVSAMGGRIWVSSREGEGSSFVFELPASRQSVLVERE